jgi:large subunit ribosomal protein L25
MDVSLRVDARTERGSASARRLRARGLVPAVVYGAGIEGAIPVKVGRRDLVAALSTEAGRNALITLELDGSSHLTLARELQTDAVRHEVIHVDFVAIRRDQEVAAAIPITLVGEAPASREGLAVAQQLFALSITALPGNIPGHIEVDVSGLEGVGDSIRASDIALPPGVTVVTDLDETIVAVAAAVVEEVPEEVEEALEAAEGEAPAAGEAAPETGPTGSDGPTGSARPE